MITRQPKPAELREHWYAVDAEGLILGRLATQVATILRGKHEPTFAPHVATKNHVIITNAHKIKVTGNKLEAKLYYRHSGQPGALKERTLAEQLVKQPTRPVEDAIRRMLPDNKLRAVWMTHLHVYAGNEHPHQAQQPQELVVDRG